MLESGEYKESVESKLQEGLVLQENTEGEMGEEFVVISLKN